MEILLIIILILSIVNTIILVNPSIKSLIYEIRMAQYNKRRKQIMDTRHGSDIALLERLKKVKYTKTK